MKVYGQQLEEYMSELVKEDLLNEERFARAYTRGKYRIKKWGWQKINLELKRREVSDYCIRKAYEEIDQNEYSQNLNEILRKYLHSKGDMNEYEKKSVAYKFAYSKGYEPALITSSLKELLA
jgi:regulatory protein